MLHKTQSISLHSVRYSDSSLVCYLYTLHYGRVAVLVNSAYGKGRKVGKAVLFSPLSMLDIVFYKTSRAGMGRLKEVVPTVILGSIPYHPVKRAISLFMGEVIYRSVREEECNEPLFDFLSNSIQMLDLMEAGLPNFHLLFLVNLSKHLGFYPHGNFSAASPYFDIKSGHFVGTQPKHPQFFDEQNSRILASLLGVGIEQRTALTLNGSQRTAFMERMLAFYTYHLDGIHYIKSLGVLSQVFED